MYSHAEQSLAKLKSQNWPRLILLKILKETSKSHKEVKQNEVKQFKLPQQKKKSHTLFFFIRTSNFLFEAERS